jgi:hypothetical protein
MGPANERAPMAWRNCSIRCRLYRHGGLDRLFIFLSIGELRMETKHTPGPWEYVPGNENHGPYVVSDYGSDIADCYTMSNLSGSAVCNGGDSKPVPFCGEQAEANARLIAAAPELLEVLEYVLMADKFDGAMTHGNAALSPAIRDKIERAIAKAT